MGRRQWAIRDISRIPIERVAHQLCQEAQELRRCGELSPTAGRSGATLTALRRGRDGDRFSACIMHHAREVWIGTRFGRLSKRQTNGPEKGPLPELVVWSFFFFSPRAFFFLGAKKGGENSAV